MTTSSPSAEALGFLKAPHPVLIGGRWVEGQGRAIEVENPASGKLVTTLRAASPDQLDTAVAAARVALCGDWGRSSGRDRGIVLNRFADLLEANLELVAEVMTIDNGSPLASSRMVVRHLAVEMFRYYAGWATKIAGESFQPSLGARPNLDILVATVQEPVGVVGAIVPWNAPAGMIALKMAPALAAGCALVLKTAELAPLVRSGGRVGSTHFGATAGASVGLCCDWQSGRGAGAVGRGARAGPGYFLGSTLFTEVTPGMRIEQEEVFGPVLSAIRFSTEDELIRAVNGTTYALSGSVWTQDIQRAMRLARRIDSGQVGLNIHAAMSPETPFGGNRQSGWGREFGREGLDPYLKTKAVSINLGPKP